METSVQFIVDDTSPTISYSPFRDSLSTPDLSAGWNPYYNLSGFIHAQGEVGNGTSLHITSLNGASLALQFHGTGIELRGNVTLASYAVSVDGQAISSPASTSQNNILANIQNLKDGAHNVTLTAEIPQGQNPPNSSMLVFEQAIILSSPIPVSSNVTFQPKQIDDSDIAFLGRWTFETAPSGASFHTSKTTGDRAVIAFNGTTFIMQGMTSPDAGSYSVTLDNVTTTLNGRSSFTVYDALLFFASELNSTVEHIVVVENLDGGQLSLLSDGVNVFVPLNLSATTPPSTNGTSRIGATTDMSFPEGTIAAFILSGILGFILLTGCLFYFLYYRPKMRRRRRHIANDRLERSPKEQEAGMVLDIGPNDVGNVFKNVDYEEEDINPVPDRRRSAMSGFSRWRREAVHGSLGSVSLPVHFRHSDSDDKNNTNSNAEERPGSGRSSEPPSSSSSAKRARAKKKGKMRQITGRSWSPSFMVDLPLRRSRPPTAEQPTSPRITSIGNLSSFVAAEPSPQKTRNVDPPSYAASVSNHDSIRNSNSDPSSGIPSGPRSVSANASYPRIHYREDTRGFLLHEGEPDSDQDSQPVDLPPQHQHHPHQSPPAEVILMMPLTRHHGGSPSTEDDPSITEPSSMRQVLRSLSPRTSETPQRHSQRRRTVVGESSESQAESPGGFPPLHMFLEDEPEDQSARSKQLPRTPSADENSEDEIVDVKDGVFLSVRATSPFRVDFDSRSTRIPTASDGDAGSTDAPYFTAVSSTGKNQPSRKSPKRSNGTSARIPLPEFVQGTSRLPFRLTPMTWRPVSPPKQLSSSGQGSDGVTSFLDFSSSREGSMRSHSIRPGTSGSESVFEARLSLPGPMEPRSRWSNTTAPTQRTGTAGSEQDRPIDENRLSVPGPMEPRSRWSNTTVPTIATGPAAPSVAPPANDSSSESHKVQPSSPEAHSSDSNTFPIPVQVIIPPTPHQVMDTATDPNPNPHRRSETSNQSNFTQGGEPLHVHPVLENLESPTDSIPLTMSEIHFVNSDGEDAAHSRRTTDVSSLQPPVAPSEEFQPRPFDPSILVSRVLGISPPSSATTRPNHARSASAAATFSSFPSSSPQRPGPSQSNDHFHSSTNVSGQSLS